MNKEPKLMDATKMRDIITPHLAQIHENIFISDELGIFHCNLNLFKLLINQKPPFCINDHRLGIVLQGEAHINFNLQDRHITAPTLVYLGPGTIINPIRISNDLEVFGMALFANFPMPFVAREKIVDEGNNEALPSAFNGQVRDFQLPVGETDLQTARQMMETILRVVRQPDYHRATVSALVAALLHHYDHLFQLQKHQLALSRSREQTIFDRFIQLVNQHCREQHQLAYYASRLCLTQRYLCTVVRQASGTTAKDWIDRALITRIKIELRHSQKSAAQIAEEMNFPNPSFFSKYFHRLTGMTPMEFKSK